MSTEAGSSIWPEGYARLILDECRSTMLEASSRAQGGQPGKTWIMARSQTGGHGRRGRPWAMAPGNLAATLLLRPECTAQEAARRSFMAANALFEALALYVDRDLLALKWPNDVLLDGAKVAGILLEASGQGPFVDWLSVGFGVNLAEAPPDDPDMAVRPTSLATHGDLVGPEEFLEALASYYATEEAVLAQLGFQRIRDEWLERAARLGEVITARTGRETLTGVFETVDDDGNLILLTDAGRKVISAADVYF